jgi:photosystem II stability/assembly factor-like uncharacterized protein
MRKILALLFVLIFSASAFAWTQGVIDANNALNDIDGYVGTSLATLCAVGNSGALYFSTNYGKTWSAPVAKATSYQGVTIAGNLIWIAGDNIVEVSTDWGASWNYKNPAFILFANPGGIQDITFADANHGVVVGKTAGNAPLVAYTVDGGTNWTNVTPGTLFSVPNTVRYISSRNEYWMVAPSGNIWNSSNGTSWTQKWGTGQNLQDIYFTDVNNGFAVGTPNSFMYTTDGGTTWTENLILLTSTDNYGVYFSDANTGWVAGFNNARITKLTRSGVSWSSSVVASGLNDGDDFNAIFGFDSKNMWVVGSGTGIVVSNVTVEATAASQEGKTFNRVPQGFGGNITVNGNFQIGPTAVAFSDTGVTASGAVTRLNANQLRVPVTVTPTATISNRNITVNINGFTATLLNGLAVVPGPTINALDPARVYQNWIGTVTATGSAFQVDPLSTIVFDPQTAGATVEIIGTPTIVSTTTAVATVSASSVGNFRVWVMNADTGRGFYDFFVVNSFSPPTPESIAFNGITYDATDYPPDGRQLISPTPRVTAIFTDNEQGFNTSSQNNAKLLLVSNGTLSSIYNVTPESVRLEAGNTRAVIDYQIPSGLAFPPSVNTVQAYIENSSGEASRIAAKVRIGYAMMSGVSDRIALAYPVKWDPDKDDHLDLQFKTKVDPLPLSFMIEGFNIAGMRIFSLPATPRVVFSYSGPDNPYKIVKVSLRKSDYQSSLHLLSQGLLLMIIPEANVRAKVMVQYR